MKKKQDKHKASKGDFKKHSMQVKYKHKPRADETNDPSNPSNPNIEVVNLTKNKDQHDGRASGVTK